MHVTCVQLSGLPLRANRCLLLSKHSRLCLSTRRPASKPDPKNGPSGEDILKAGVDLAKTYLANDPKWRLATDVAAKLLDDPAAAPKGSALSASRSKVAGSQAPGSGVYVLLVVIASIFVVKNDFAQGFFEALHLHHVNPSIWQYATASFCAGAWVQLSSALFMVYTFGQQLEHSDGPLGLWSAYILCGCGATIAAAAFFPAKLGKIALVSGTAIYAAFGVFIAAQIASFQPVWQKFIQIAVIGQFIVRVVATETAIVSLPSVLVLGQALSPQLLAMSGAAVGAVAYMLLLQLWGSLSSMWEKKK